MSKITTSAPTAGVVRHGRWSPTSGPAMVARYTRAERASDALRYL